MYKYLKGGCKEVSARLFSLVPSDRTRGNGHRLKHRKLPLNSRKDCFTEGDLALAEVAQTGCGVSLLRDIKNLNGHNPE